MVLYWHYYEIYLGKMVGYSNELSRWVILKGFPNIQTIQYSDEGLKMKVKNVAVIGGAGFVGIELVRHILAHPGLRLVAATSDSEAGKPLTELYPALHGRTELVFIEHQAIDVMTNLDAVFLAVPHTAAMEMAPKLLVRGIYVFDLSADFRLKNAEVYEQWYGTKHTAPGLLSAAIYGLPEINRALLYQKFNDNKTGLSPMENPTLVACPGCYPTASVLAVAPALVAGFSVAEPIIINAISGVSGAGRAPRQGTQFCAVDENVNAYSVTSHRHTPEIAQALSWQAGRDVRVLFTPHLAPLKRGLLSTVSLRVKPGVTAAALESVYNVAYAAEPFVKMLPYGSMPRTASVAMTNNAQVGIAFCQETRTLVASCAIDNLGKGAASQAIQCANILFGFDEASGLSAIPGLV